MPALCNGLKIGLLQTLRKRLTRRKETPDNGLASCEAWPDNHRSVAAAHRCRQKTCFGKADKTSPVASRKPADT